MVREKVGVVTEVEKSEIQKLFERKLALGELVPSLKNPELSQEEKDALYEKIVDDMGKTNMMLQQWWNEKSIKYEWKSSDTGSWTIDFITNEIFLIERNEYQKPEE